jgi:hypothetical protein
MEHFGIGKLGLDSDIVEVLQDPEAVDSLLHYYKAVGLAEERRSKESDEPDIVSKVDSTAGADFTTRHPSWNRIMKLACFFFTGCCEYYCK